MCFYKIFPQIFIHLFIIYPLILIIGGTIKIYASASQRKVLIDQQSSPFISGKTTQHVALVSSGFQHEMKQEALAIMAESFA